MTPGEVAVIIHGSRAQLYAAQPELPLVSRLTSPEARRYLTGWPSTRELHMLAPRHLRSRSSKVPGSREMSMLAPAALYSQLVVGANNPSLPPPFRPMALTRMLRSAWLWAGAGQWFSGQTAYARPAIARRLREGTEPSFPPSMRDALLLGGSVLDLLAAESGAEAVVRLVTEPSSDGSARALSRAFGGQSLVQVGGEWRAHLARMAGQQTQLRTSVPIQTIRATTASPPKRPTAIRPGPSGAEPADGPGSISACSSTSRAASTPDAGTRTSRGPAASMSGTSKPRERRSIEGTPSSSSRPWISSASAWWRAPATLHEVALRDTAA